MSVGRAQVSRLHPLLERQLRRSFGDLELVPEQFQGLLHSIDQAYRGFDEDRQMLERSLDSSARELVQANSEIGAVLRAIPDVFMWIGEDDRITNTQAGEPQDLYRSSIDLLGKRITEIPVPAVARRFADGLRHVRTIARVVSFDYELTIDRRRSLYEARLLPLVDGQIIAVIRNVTARRRVGEAEEANRLKSEFLANMSHELRTPLHGILSFAGFGLRRGDSCPEKLEGYFEQIRSNGQTLLGLVDGLLDLAKLESGKTTLDIRPANIAATLESVADEFSSRLSERGLVLEADWGDSEAEGHFDEQRIKQVVRNLVANATKFSPDGGTIGLRTSCQGGKLVVEVRDQGPGVPEDELAFVFQKFYQSTNTRTRAGGTGLGLAVSQHIVEIHGGSISVANNLDRGATFSFSIPLRAGANPSTL